jgi:hypothetical protein
MVTQANDNGYSGLFQFLFATPSNGGLVEKIKQDPPRFFSILQSIKMMDSDSLAAKQLAKLLYQINFTDLENPIIKKIETILRNKGIFNPKYNSDVFLQVDGKKGSIGAHKTILALESPYFRGIQGLSDSQMSEIMMEKIEISPQAFQSVVDYLYLSDQKRIEFLSNADKMLLFSMAKLADVWQLDELKARCDEELCNSLDIVDINRNDWVAHSHLVPKFAMLLEFIKREVSDYRMSLKKPMLYWEVATRFAAKCTPEEITVFSTLNTEFGKACRVLEGAFGPKEWEKTFPVTIVDYPPLPHNILSIMELEDPWEPGKTLKDTCLLFLRPKSVIFHDESGDKRITLRLDGLRKLALNATNAMFRRDYRCEEIIKTKIDTLPLEDTGWVLMRKQIIPGSKGKNIMAQKQLSNLFSIPKVMDALLLNIITYASEGKFPFGQNEVTFCKERYKNPLFLEGGGPISVGFVRSILEIGYFFDYGSSVIGMAGSFKFT